MKRMIPNRPVVAAILAIAAVILLSTCSGVIGGDNMVRISIPGMADTSRFISSDANSGYVVVLQEDRVYSLNNFSDMAYQELVNGNVMIANLPVGTYIFGIVLIDDKGTENDNDDDNVGLAIKERKVEAGFNDFLINVGPGIDTFEVNGADFEDFFTPDGYKVRFAEDTIILSIERRDIGDDIELIFEDGSTEGEIITGGVAGGAATPGPSWAISPDEDGVETTTTVILPPTAPATTPTEYKLSVIFQ